MKLIQNLRTWWQVRTGEEETPFDGDTPAWVCSMFFHLALLIAIAMIPIVFVSNQVTLVINSPLEEEEPIEEVVIPEDFYFSEQPQEEIGANSMNGVEMALSEAPEVSEVSDIPLVAEVEPTTDYSNIQINETITVATGLNYNQNLAVKGAAGVGETGAMGAIDRITHEILLSLEERKTLVVWLLDQSASVSQQRTAIHDRMQRIYEELGVIEAAGNERFRKHSDKPLLSSVVAFGKNVTLLTKQPTDNLAEIKAAIAGIEQDNTGVELTFSAVYMAANEYKGFRTPDPTTRQPERNVMLVVFTDEVGEDQDGLEPTIKLCRRYEMPVYVVGVPAPFGRQETMVKWIDPDPNYDQTPQWGRVDQGPESFMPERLKLNIAGMGASDPIIDSGFGPYALTRLAYETGGIYFTVHPNRNAVRAVSRGEVEPFAAHIEHFFDPQVMRKYRPDYVPPEEYMRRLSVNKARGALVKAAQMSWVTQMENPKLRFVKRDEAAFNNDLTEAQKEAAKLEPKLNALYETIRLGEADRPNEETLRWQAGFDLAYGRIVAAKVRTEAYNAMLAEAKRGLKPKDEKSNTWTLKPADEISIGSQMAKLAEKARESLQRVVDEHPGTPWALIAKKELETPIGWKWEESFTDLTPRREGMGNGNNNNAPANDALQMLQRAPPKRPPPKL